jgi:hypothetical protein
MADKPETRFAVVHFKDDDERAIVNKHWIFYDEDTEDYWCHFPSKLPLGKSSAWLAVKEDSIHTNKKMCEDFLVASYELVRKPKEHEYYAGMLTCSCFCSNNCWGQLFIIIVKCS